ncbi:MAG: HigA family addiction module antidote protein [Lentisphaeria bacterium]|nr:HigA family addiction module antidote protein [Lentisphaeria bacterium]
MANEEKFLKPVHPGEVLFYDFMQPLNISQNALARAIGVPPRRINEIVHGKRSITADTAIRLSRFFGTTAEVWMGLQAEYELDSITYEEHTQGKSKFDFIERFVPKVAAML